MEFLIDCDHIISRSPLFSYKVTYIGNRGIFTEHHYLRSTRFLFVLRRELFVRHTFSNIINVSRMQLSYIGQFQFDFKQRHQCCGDLQKVCVND